MDVMASALAAALSWDTLFGTFLGVVGGVLIGVLPGLTSTMAVALLIPFTFSLPPVVGLAMLGGIYCASTYGGAITAILFNIPGTPSAAATILDGHPLALRGEATRAISVVTLGSAIGGLFSALVLLLLAPPLARFALQFGASEYFLLGVLGVSIIASLSEGSMVKGLISGVLGLIMSTVGMHPLTGFLRFTYGQPFLYEGVPLIVALIGLFSIPEVISLISQRTRGDAQILATYEGNVFRYIRDLITYRWTVIRSSIIGTIIGIIPGAGTDIAAFLAYNEARRTSKEPERFGRGAVEGVLAPEAANNAVTGGTLVPLLTLGVPGNAVTAIFMGGLLIHGLRPGASLFTDQATITYGFIFSLFVSNILFVPVGLIAARFATRLLRVPPTMLAPTIVVLAVFGSYALRSSPEDVWLMLGMGLVGYGMKLAGIPAGPMVLGLVLGGMVEGELARALAMVQGNVWMFLTQLVTRPISAVLLVLCLLSLGQGIARQRRAAKPSASA